MEEQNKKEQNIERRKIDKKNLIKIIIKIALLLVGGFIFISILPFLGFIAIVLYSVFIDVPAKPKVKHGEFPFELIY